MATYRNALFRNLRACSTAAAQSFLAPGEAAFCSNIYLKLKLSFLNGVTVARYAQMSEKTRAVANEKGYAAYRAWLHRQTVSAE